MARARRFKEGLLHAARCGGLLALARPWSRKGLRILAYHGLWTTPGYQYGDRLFISPEQFERRMIWLKNSDYTILPLGEAVRRLAEDCLPDFAVAITIDDGWASTYSHMLPILERLGLPATVYVTTWYSARQSPVVNVAVDYMLKRAGQSPERATAIADEITRRPSLEDREEALRSLATDLDISTQEWWDTRQFHVMSSAEIRDADQRGLDIQLHTHRHRSVSQNVDHLEVEIADNRAALAAACNRGGTSFDQFCYPSGDYNASAEAILKAAGIRSATLVEEGVNFAGTNVYQLRRFLDGRSVSQAAFEAYLSGALEVYRLARELAAAAKDVIGG
jgi:peptidoglycan/xylan/chitin deacetylase (PgdA/CDA1 family)